MPLFFLLVAAPILFSALLKPAVADDYLNDSVTFGDAMDGLENAPGYDTVPDKKNWKFRLGAIVGVKPDYEGSDEYEFAAAPDIMISWKDTVVLNGDRVRLQWRRKGLRVGALVRLESGRDEDDNNNLNGLGDVDSGASGGFFLNYEFIKNVTLKTEVRQEFAGGHDGLLADFGVEAKVPPQKPFLKLYFGGTYASRNYMEEFFGVSSTQATRSGLQQFNADSGLKNYEFSVSWGYDITKNWVLGLTGNYKLLVGDADDSPIVDDKGSQHQFAAGLGLSYQF